MPAGGRRIEGSNNPFRGLPPDGHSRLSTAFGRLLHDHPLHECPQAGACGTLDVGNAHPCFGGVALFALVELLTAPLPGSLSFMVA